MGEVNEYGSFREGDIVEHVDATVKSVVHFASNVQDSLDGIRDNTKSLYWWTSILVGICLGLFLLAQLVRLRHELQTITQYQELFMRMWEDDRRREDERHEEEKRERQIEERNRRARAAARQYRGGRGGGTAGRDEGASSSNVNTSPKTPTRGRGFLGNSASGASQAEAQEENTTGLSFDDPLDLTTPPLEPAQSEDALADMDDIPGTPNSDSNVDVAPKALEEYMSPFGDPLSKSPRFQSLVRDQIFTSYPSVKRAPAPPSHGPSAFSSSINSNPKAKSQPKRVVFFSHNQAEAT